VSEVSYFDFTEKELKLLNLALDSAAAEGESANSWMMLLRSLRQRGVDGYTIESAINNQPITIYDAGNIVMPFGAYKGLALKSIPTSYLEFLVTRCGRQLV
jgi:hypothetical protein